jgi:hypothetical protein
LHSYALWHVPDSTTLTCIDPTSGSVVSCSSQGEDSDYVIDSPNYVATTHGNGAHAYTTYQDSVTQLIWRPLSASTQAPDVTTAIGLCCQLGTSWRLPTTIELISLLDLGVSTQPKVAPALATAILDQGYLSEDNFVVNFGNGSVSPGNGGSYQVTCVEDGVASLPSGPPLSISINLDGTYTDLNTGLTWYFNSGAQGAWADALGACNQLSARGQCPGSWRLPSDKEILTLTEFSTQGLLPYQLGSQTYWTSSIIVDPNGASAHVMGWQFSPKLQVALGVTNSSPLAVACVTGP